MTQVSFEFFPGRDRQSHDGLITTAVGLAESFHPRFVSVTYGAGGTTQDHTIRAVSDLAQQLTVPVAGHLTTVNSSISQVHEVIDQYIDAGVDHIVALRGDPPKQPTPATKGGYETAADLVEGIRQRQDGNKFKIFVAAYPEVHPRAKSPQDDLENLKRKLDVGADEAISQFFFDPDVFLNFLDQARSANIDAPIVPGLIPITNFNRIQHFAQSCGATVPSWLTKLMSGAESDPELSQLLAASVLAHQCRQLEKAGIDKVHIYTMNRRPLTATVCHVLGLNRP